MRELTFSRFNKVSDNKAKPETRTWESWSDIFQSHELRKADPGDKDALEKSKDGPCVVLGEIPAGMPHRDKNVVMVHAIGLDIEGKTEAEVDAALEPLLNYEFVLYSTHKHRAAVVGGCSRLRVILPLAEPIPPNKFPAVWQGLNVMTKRITDQKTRNVARLFYLPSTYDKEVAVAWRSEGDWIHPEDLVRYGEDPTKEGTAPVGAIERAQRFLRLMPKEQTTDGGVPLKEHARAVLEGGTFGGEGSRHDIILALTMYLAQKSAAQPLPVEAVNELFRASIEAWKKVDAGAPDLDDVTRCYCGAVEKVAASITEEKEKREERAREFQLRGDEPYSDAELKAIAEAQGWEPTELKRRWIVQKDVSFYILNQFGHYAGPYSVAEARQAAATLLARAPILLNEPTKNGVRRRTIHELVEDYGQVAVEVVCDLTKRKSAFDPVASKLLEASRPVRAIAPVFDETFDKFLHVLAGKAYDKLWDWLACVPDLDKLLCALYLAGGPGSGKTSIAYGLAKLWHEGPPTEVERIISDFNADLVQCPLILADEHVPKYWKGSSVTTKLRSLVSIQQRTLSRKYLPPATLVGAVRLILSANNEFLLGSQGVMTAQDLEAIAQRFLYIEVPDEATKFVEAVPERLKAWWLKEGIAAHALYLEANRVVKKAPRFWVEGDVGQMHRLLTITTDYNDMVCEWLVRYLLNPKPVDGKKDGLIRIFKGTFLVNDQAVIDGWEFYFPKSKMEPVTGKIGAALRAIAKKERHQLRYNGRPIRYREIDIENLYAWSENRGIGNKHAMEITLGLREDDTGSMALVTDDLPSCRPVTDGFHTLSEVEEKVAHVAKVVTPKPIVPKDGGNGKILKTSGGQSVSIAHLLPKEDDE
jgi:hypothetical protein